MLRSLLPSLVAALLTTGCPATPGEGGDGGTDAAPDSPLRVGSEYTLELATWNIRNFPSDEGTPADLAALLGKLDLDLVAVQEIADIASWDDMTSALPSHDSVLSPDEYSFGGYQKTGFLWRRGLLELVETKSLWPQDWWAFPRPPLQARFIAQHPAGGTMSFVAIVVHLKASSDNDSEARRRLAIASLVDHVDALVADDASGEDEVVILGDFNDTLDDWPEDNVFTPLLDDPGHYQILTSPLAANGEHTIGPWGRFIDHIVITTGLQYEYAGGRTEVIPLDRAASLMGTDFGYSYEGHISDHIPVVAIFPWVDRGF